MTLPGLLVAFLTLALRPLSALGLGLQVIGNLNSADAVAAFTVFLELGKLR